MARRARRAAAQAPAPARALVRRLAAAPPQGARWLWWERAGRSPVGVAGEEPRVFAPSRATRVASRGRAGWSMAAAHRDCEARSTNTRPPRPRRATRELRSVGARDRVASG